MLSCTSVTWSEEKDLGNRSDFVGDFLLVSKRCCQEKEDDLISQVIVERVDSNSGAETRQGQKKGSGRWNRDRNTAGCCSGTWTKILYRVTGQGGGAAGTVVYKWEEVAVCVIVYHISIDHSHLNWKQWVTFRSLIDFSEVKTTSSKCVLECNFGTVNPFWTLNSCIRASPGRSAEDGVDKLFNPFTMRYFSDFTGLCRGWVRVPPMRNIGF